MFFVIKYEKLNSCVIPKVDFYLHIGISHTYYVSKRRPSLHVGFIQKETSVFILDLKLNVSVVIRKYWIRANCEIPWIDYISSHIFQKKIYSSCWFIIKYFRRRFILHADLLSSNYPMIIQYTIYNIELALMCRLCS